MKTLCALALFAVTAFGQNSIDKPRLESYLRRLELLIPAVKIEISDPVPTPYLQGFSSVTVQFSYNDQRKEEHYMVSSDGETLIRGEAFPLKRSPFQSNIDRMKTEGQPSFGGPPNAPVTLVMYVDLQCPFCKAESAVVRNNVEKTFGNKVRVVFRDFPVVEVHPWAGMAAIAARCIYRQNEKKFWNFHDWIFDKQAEVTMENFNTRVNKWVADNGVKAADFATCSSTKATEPEIAASIQEGKSLGVGATPTTFLNGSKMEGTIEWDVLRQLINVELERVGAGGK